MNDKRKIGLFIVVLGFIFLILLIYWTFFRGRPSPVEPGPEMDPTVEVQLPTIDEPELTPGDRPRDRQVYDINQEVPHQPDINDASKLAMSFAERLGSFSSQSNYSNIKDLQLFMTSGMKEWSETYITRLRQENPSETYYGITTHALGTEIISYNEAVGQAKIRVATQRREVKEAVPGENLFLQNLTLDIVKQAGDWKVSGAYWENR